jgi:hypothetical protein
MSVSIGTVLGASAVVSSPLIWQVYHDSLGEGVALQRWVVCAVVCWVALTLVDMLMSTGKPPSSLREPEPAQDGAVATDAEEPVH